MTEHAVSRSQWHDAAALAPFTPYEPIGSSERWAGGFGGEGNHLEVIALVHGVEVSVDTAQPGRHLPDRDRLRIALAELLWRHTLEGEVDPQLPYSLSVLAEDRTVIVGEQPYTAHGMRIDGDARWVGSIRLEDVTVRITTTSSEAPSLRPCAAVSSLPESRPFPR
ncbi:MAG: hypothetical protein JWN62_2500 [Acidimicrobiales bacterium]|nr:hypothetical protein [Acidimicrobiales bacterium]